MSMFKYLRIILQCGWKILWIYFRYIVRYAAHPERYPLKERYDKVRELFTLVLDHFRIDWKIKGLENIRQLEKEGKRFLLVPNHLSDLDAICIIYWCEEPVSFVAKKEALKFPFVGKAIKAVDGYFLDRGDLRDGVRMMKDTADKLSSGKCSVLIYPEGTRNREPFGPMLSFHPGSFKSLYKAGVPVIGVGQFGSQLPLQKDNNYKRYPVYVSFLSPIYKEEYEKYLPVDFAPLFERMIAEEVYAERFLFSNYFIANEEKVPLKGKKAVSIR